MDAYGAVTERLQHTQEKLTNEVRRLQHELASANAEVVRSKRLAALGEMATGIAHEVRNPLASIKLYATMLEEDLHDQPASCDIAQKIGSAVRGLDAVVGDVLAFSREMRLGRVIGAPRPIFEAALETTHPLLAENNIHIAWAIEDENMDISHDPGLIHRAIVNLIRNAAQALAHQNGDRIITLGACLNDEMAQLIIADTGPGISEDQIDRIFNPFFTTRPTGTGLGLPIVHRIIDAHGGAIGVHNAHGAVFTLALPIEVTEQTPVAQAWPEVHVKNASEILNVSQGV